jgi:predicted ATP-dependent protease
MHERLVEMRTKYGDSDENNQKFLKIYLDELEKQEQARIARQAKNN